MGGEDEPDRRGARARAQVVGRDGGEAPERVLERLPGNPSFVCVLAAAAQAVVLLGEVRELEVEPERAEDESLRVGIEIVDHVGGRDGAVAPRVTRDSANALDEVEQPATFLLDEHVAENRPEQPDVAAERGGGVGHRGSIRSAGRAPPRRRAHRVSRSWHATRPRPRARASLR